MRTLPLLLTGMLFSAASLAAGTTHFEKKVSADAAGRVRVSNVSGSVDIRGWDRPEVEVLADMESGVERVDVVQSGGSVEVRVMLRFGVFGDGSARLQVRVPSGSQLEVSTVSASSTVEGVQGQLRVNSVSGGIRADIPAAEAVVKSVSGSIALRGSGKPARLRVSTVSGSVSLRDGAGDVDAASTSGSLNVAVSPATSIHMNTVSGSLDFRGRLARNADFEARTVSGALLVNAESEAGYRYEVSTLSGAIATCFGDAASSPRAPGRGNEVEGTRGAGAANLRIKSYSGAVSLCDHR
jgi:hypothetical protein